MLYMRILTPYIHTSKTNDQNFPYIAALLKHESYPFSSKQILFGCFFFCFFFNVTKLSSICRAGTPQEVVYILNAICCVMKRWYLLLF